MAIQLLYTFLIITTFGVYLIGFTYVIADKENIELVKQIASVGAACAYFGSLASFISALFVVWQ